MNTFKKIISSVLIIAAIAGAYGFPPKARAQLATAEAGPSLWQQIINTINTTATSISTYTLEFKAFVLDTLATTLAKQLIRQITADVVNWINSGFDGSPAFITNPGGFFLDMADQITGEFLSKKENGPLADLCSPFSIDIRLALAFKYHPRIQKKYSCTLGQIIANTAGVSSKEQQAYRVASGQERLDDSSNVLDRSTINGRSMKGFMDGDFSQGGWPAFVSLTTEPQNNPYGAYLEANSEIGIRVANAQLLKREELGAGKGFLSWRNQSCIKQVRATRAAEQASSVDPAQETAAGEAGAKYLADKEFYEDELGADLEKTERDCPIDTPGSLIVSNLETSINGPLHELELVDSINEIVNALAAQLVNTVLKGGLRAISGASASDSTSYINRIQAEANGVTSDHVKELRGEFIGKINKATADTLTLKASKDDSLNVIAEVKETYESAKACYISRNNSAYSFQIQQIDTIINTKIIPRVTPILGDSVSANTLYTTLLGFKTRVESAQTVNDMNTPTKEFAAMLSSGRLTSPKQIVDAQQENQEIRNEFGPLLTDAKQKLNLCEFTTTGVNPTLQLNN